MRILRQINDKLEGYARYPFAYLWAVCGAFYLLSILFGAIIVLEGMVFYGTAVMFSFGVFFLAEKVKDIWQAKAVMILQVIAMYLAFLAAIDGEKIDIGFWWEYYTPMLAVVNSLELAVLITGILRRGILDRLSRGFGALRLVFANGSNYSKSLDRHSSQFQEAKE